MPIGAKVTPEMNAIISEMINIRTQMNEVDGEYFSDFEFGKKAVSIFNGSQEGGSYSLVEVTYPFEKPKLLNNLLGYDVLVTNEGNRSLILEYLLQESNSTEQGHTIYANFRSALNKEGLFNDFETAYGFLREMKPKMDKTFELSILCLFN